MRYGPLLQALTRLLSGRRVLYTDRVAFGRCKVVERRWQGEYMRLLDVDGSLQSATYVDDRWCTPPFPYLKAFSCVFEGAHPARDLLLLGGGGYAFPRHVIAHHPDATIEVCEVDPKVTSIAREYFFLDRLEDIYGCLSSGRLTIYEEDALSCLRRRAAEGRRYDAILNDCYRASEADERITGDEATRLAHECLATDGLYVTNLITAISGEESLPLMGLTATLAQEFACVCALPIERVPPDAVDNVCVIASDADPMIDGAVPLVGIV